MIQRYEISNNILMKQNENDWRSTFKGQRVPG